MAFAELSDPVCLIATRDKRARRCHDFLPFTLIFAHPCVAQPANRPPRDGCGVTVCIPQVPFRASISTAVAAPAAQAVGKCAKGFIGIAEPQ